MGGFPLVLPAAGCWGHLCSCRREQANPWHGSLIPTPGNFTGVKGDEKHREAPKPRAGVDYLNGLGIPDQGWCGADGVCLLLLLWGYGGQWWVESSISHICNPSPFSAQPPLPPKSLCDCCPSAWVWAAACIPSPGVEGKLGYGALSPFLSHCVPRESGHRMGAAGSLFHGTEAPCSPLRIL